MDSHSDAIPGCLKQILSRIWEANQSARIYKALNIHSLEYTNCRYCKSLRTSMSCDNWILNASGSFSSVSLLLNTITRSSISLIKSCTLCGIVLNHAFTTSSTLIFLSFASNTTMSPQVTRRIMTSVTSFPMNSFRSRNTFESSSVNRLPYFIVKMMASNPCGAIANILHNSVRVFSLTFLVSFLIFIPDISLIGAVPISPGVSMTLIFRSVFLLPYLQCSVPDVAISEDDLKTSLPMIRFPVALFPLPVLPRRTTVRSFPLRELENHHNSSKLQWPDMFLNTFRSLSKGWVKNT